MRRVRLHSVGARLSLALLFVVAGALATVYLVVVPSLEERLVDGRRSQVERIALQFEQTWRFDPPQDREQADGLVAGFGSATNTQVIVLAVVEGDPVRLSVAADGGAGRRVEGLITDPTAFEAAEKGRAATRIVTRDETRYVESARVVAPGVVVLVASSLADADRAVSLVQRRILTAGALALVAALLVGFGGAHFFARRIQRLERAANRIAGGRFDEPVVDPASDELGELARTFDRMRERLARLERARREFIANASHELRTPLFSLGGHLELLTEEELDDQTRSEFLQRSREQVERLTKLAAELLDLSRLDAGRMHIEREPVDLAHVADLLVEEFGPAARRSQHTLQLSRDGDVEAVADEQRVVQIGRALVENALRHTPSGTTVRVQAERRNGQAVLEVEDDGPGIASDHASHVFERFYRADGTHASGSGLGLAIARELAEVMDGTLDLESRPGRTIFRVSLPTT